jgi:hypothetical protein
MITIGSILLADWLHRTAVTDTLHEDLLGVCARISSVTGWISTYISICLPVYLSIYPSVCLSVCLSIYGSTVLLLELGRFFNFLILYTDGRTPWTGDQPVARPLPTHRTTQTQTSIPWVGFEPTIPAFEREKTAHALDRAATVLGHYISSGSNENTWNESCGAQWGRHFISADFPEVRRFSV